MTAKPALAVPRKALDSDWETVKELLEKVGLPLEGARDHFANFSILGNPAFACAGMERYGAVALLRSVAVSPKRQGEGVGRCLVNALLASAKAQGIKDVYLLTTTAAEYFASHWGFATVGRDELPPALSASTELRGACPLAAAVLHLRL